MGKSYVLIFFCSQLLVYKSFLGKSYVFIFSIGSCWYTKFLWARVTFSFFQVAVVGIQSLDGQELCSHFSCWQLLVYKLFMAKSYLLIFFCWQLLVYKVFMAKSYLLIFPVGSCWYTKFLWPRVIFSFFLLAVVGIQRFYGQELSSHFFCWQLLVYKVLWPRVTFSFLLLAVVGIQSFYGQELRSHFFLLAVVGIQSFNRQELSSHFFCSQLLVYKVFMGKSYVLIFPVGSCWYTKFLWARVTFSFFLLAVVGIQTFHGQELSSHFFCW